MTREEIEALRKDPRNRKWGVYYCKADPRVIVPKRSKWMGWTINAAHPLAIPVALLLVAILLVPIFVVKANGSGTGIMFIAIGVCVTALCLICAYLSSRTS